MVGIVEPDGDEIADAAQAWPDSGRPAHRGQGFRLELGQTRERPRSRASSASMSSTTSLRSRVSRPCRRAPAFPCPPCHIARVSSPLPIEAARARPAQVAPDRSAGRSGRNKRSRRRLVNPCGSRFPRTVEARGGRQDRKFEAGPPWIYERHRTICRVLASWACATSLTCGAPETARDARAPGLSGKSPTGAHEKLSEWTCVGLHFRLDPGFVKMSSAASLEGLINRLIYVNHRNTKRTSICHHWNGSPCLLMGQISTQAPKLSGSISTTSAF